MPANPGRLSPQFSSYARCFPAWPTVYAALILAGGALGLLVHPVFWVLSGGALLGALLGLRRLRKRFLTGRVLPAKVVSVQPYLVAVQTDLRRNSEPYPVIRVVRQPLERMAGGPPALGTRLAALASYSGDRKNPHWDTFEPVVAGCVTADQAAIRRVCDSLTRRAWLDLEEGLRQVPTPTVPGQYPVRYPTLFSGMAHGPYPAHACTLFSPAANYIEALEVLRGISRDVEVVGPQDAWQKVVVHGSRSTLTVNALAPQTRADRFSQVVAGMYQHFAAIPTEGPVNQQRVLTGLTAARLALGIVADPEFEEEDGHFHAVFLLARRLGGILFNGYGVVDANGRVLLNGDGSFEAAEGAVVREAEGEALAGPK